MSGPDTVDPGGDSAAEAASLEAATRAMNRAIAAYRARQAALWRECGPEIARATERVFVARRRAREMACR